MRLRATFERNVEAIVIDVIERGRDDDAQRAQMVAVTATLARAEAHANAATRTLTIRILLAILGGA